jgi:hypothetical protein
VLIASVCVCLFNGRADCRTLVMSVLVVSSSEFFPDSLVLMPRLNAYFAEESEILGVSVSEKRNSSSVLNVVQSSALIPVQYFFALY